MSGRFAIAAVLAVVGCGDGIRFAPDVANLAIAGLTENQASAIETALTAAFGTPDRPIIPPAAEALLDSQAIAQAAGPVVSHTPGVTQGLYRRHCARCHGVTGDGRGPTALYQSPYPRDFRRGVFKWKRTYHDAKPTATDLARVLKDGVNGTAMPSFALLTEDEREALRQYVVYLSIRGEAERELVNYAANEAPLDESLDIAPELLTNLLEPVVASWNDAAQRVVATSSAPGSAQDVDAGRALFHSERAGCAKCHGEGGAGGVDRLSGYEPDYDVWSRQQRAAAAPGDLPPREAIARSLIGATPHGGGEPADLFRRLHQGIAGTPMPAVGGLTVGDRGALTDAEVWQLVAYIDSVSQPANHDGTQERRGLRSQGL